jgi:outer membrane protein
MRRTFLIALLWTGVAAPASAQAPIIPSAVTPSTLRVTVDDAVRMAVDHNVDLSAARLDPQISDTSVAAATGAFRPAFSTSFQRNNQLQPPASFLIPTATRTDVVASNAGFNQKLPWFGTSYSVSWNAAHTNSDSFLNSYNPVLQSGLSLNVSQPLFRDMAIDNARQQLATSRIDRDIADTRLREALVHTAANVKSAYWNLVSAIANVDARKSVLDLAEELVRVNKAKVDVGQSPPLDLVSAQAEVAADQEQVIIAETTVKEIEDQLRALIFDTSDRSAWNVKIEAVDSPPLGVAAPDLDAAVTNALRDRADLSRARKDISNAQVTVKFTGNQRLPDVRLNASYLASGLGGTQVLRAGGFPGTIVGSGAAIDFGSVLNQLFANQYPTWTVGVSVSYPIGHATEDANYARAQLEHRQSEERLKSAESRAIQQVRNAWRKIEMNAKRIETTRAARELAEQRLDAERKRFEVGISTSFLVIQAQRDLAQAKTSELAAILAYDLALVDFDALQQAGPNEPQAATGDSTTTAVQLNGR